MSDPPIFTCRPLRPGASLTSLTLCSLLTKPVKVNLLIRSRLHWLCCCCLDSPPQVLVAAFAVSGYSSTYYRAGSKPFNPLLGETYECIREDKGFCFFSEQVRLLAERP